MDEAASALRAAVENFIDRTAGGSDEEIALSDQELLEALANFRAASDGPERPNVLSWVPPVEELDDESGEDKVMLVATWFFAVEDAERALSAGRARAMAAGTEPTDPEWEWLDTVSGVVNVLFDQELDWPDIDAYADLGLNVESAHFVSQYLEVQR